MPAITDLHTINILQSLDASRNLKAIFLLSWTNITIIMIIAQVKKIKMRYELSIKLNEYSVAIQKWSSQILPVMIIREDVIRGERLSR